MQLNVIVDEFIMVQSYTIGMVQEAFVWEKRGVIQGKKNSLRPSCSDKASTV